MFFWVFTAMLLFFFQGYSFAEKDEKNLKNILAYVPAAKNEIFLQGGKENWKERLEIKGDFLEKNKFKRDYTKCFNYFCDWERALVLTDKAIKKVEDRVKFNKNFEKNGQNQNGANFFLDIEARKDDSYKKNILIKEVETRIKFGNLIDLNYLVRIETRLKFSGEGSILITGDVDSVESKIFVGYSKNISFLDHSPLAAR